MVLVGSTQSRYAEVSRRALLKGLGLVTATGTLASCSNGDSQVFVSSTPATSEATTGAASSGGPGPAASGPPLPASASLKVDFTFAAGGDGGGGPARNPYIAVWIESTGEEMVGTLAIWHAQQNERWLHELKRWYTVSGGFEVNTGPTRVPGTYSVQWNGVGREGSRVPSGQYFICIEAAREHGPYELIREPLTLGTAAVSKQLAPQGELTAAAVSYRV